MAAMRPRAPQFSVGDFIWQEIKNLYKNPQKICSYSPYIMYMIKKVTGTRFPSDVRHKPLRPPVSKNPRMPSPEAPEEEEHEIGEEDQYVQHETAAQGGTGLTGHTWDSTATGRSPHLRSRNSSIYLLECARARETLRLSSRGSGGLARKREIQ